MGSSKKHKKHKDRKHSSSNLHDESNRHSFTASHSNWMSGEQAPLKFVLRMPGASSNSPHMSPSIHNQESNLEQHAHISFTGLEGSSNMSDGRPYSSSSSKKMKKKKSKKKHKKRSHHHHSHHYHSHHKHRSSRSHHSSRSLVPTDSMANTISSGGLLPVNDQLSIGNNQMSIDIANTADTSSQHNQQQSLDSQIQPSFLMNGNNLEYSQETPQSAVLPFEPTPLPPPPPQSTSLIATDPSPQHRQPFSPPNLPTIAQMQTTNSDLPVVSHILSPPQQILDSQPQQILSSPITSPPNTTSSVNIDSNLNSNLYNAPSAYNTDFSNTCNMVNDNMVGMMNRSVVSPLANNNFVHSLQPMDTNENMNLNQSTTQQMQTASPQSTLPAIQTPSNSVQMTPAQHHQPTLIRTPVGVKPIAKTQFQSLLGYLLKQLEKRDSQEFFFWPVTDLIAPGYSSIITKPMDFSRIRQKINSNSYENLIQFRSDVKLMCDNAMTYNRPDTIYYKAARKLWHYAREKIFNRDSVLELVKLYQGVTNYELGLTCADYTDSEQINEATYGEYHQMNEQIAADDQYHYVSNDNNTETSLTNVSEEDMTPDQILMEAKKSAQKAAERLCLSKPKGSHYTLVRQLTDGTTSLAILGSNINGYQDEKYVKLESLIGKLNEGAPHLAGFKESELNQVKTIESLQISPFSSYLPSNDSSKSNLTEKETQLLQSAYGDETGLSYAQSLLKFASDSDYVMTMVDSLLDTLTGGQHSKIMDEFKEKLRTDIEMKDAQKQTTDDESLTRTNSASDNSSEENVDKMLSDTVSLVNNLESLQTQRLSSSTQPVKPNKEELRIASLLSNKLTDLINTYTVPTDITDMKSIRKALGVYTRTDAINA